MPADSEATRRGPTGRAGAPVAAGGVLILVGIVLVSLNLRPAAVSVGPVLAELRAGLGMSAASVGLLTSLPVLAFAAFGALAPKLAQVLGLHRAVLGAVLAVVAGLGGRAAVGDEVSFLALSALALAGMAVANVLMPSLVKLHYPDRIGTVTAVYTTALAIGLTGALLLTVPIGELAGSWRCGLGGWALLATLAAIPWLGLIGRDSHLAGDRGPRLSVAQVARTRLGLAMGLFFGLQSLQAYVVFGWFAQLWRDAGYSPTAAGALVAIVAGVSIPLSLWIPAAAARRDDQRGLALGLLAAYPFGYGMLLLAPYTLAIPAAVLVGVGCCVFPLALTLIGLRAHTAAGTAALSSFTQASGYLLAALGPFGIGWLHDATGGWTWPLIALLILALPLFAIVSYLGRPAYIEEQVSG